MDFDIEIAKVIVVRNGADTGHTERGTVSNWFGADSTTPCATYGSAIRRSVSLMIRLGKAILVLQYVSDSATNAKCWDWESKRCKS